jgi:Spy/CpxP family protein refolding chaperone
MRPQVKSTLISSFLGLSLALNAALSIGYFRSVEEKTAVASSNADGYCLLDRLDLDVEQQRRLAEMRRKMREKRANYWQRATAMRIELAQAISTTKTDKANLSAQLKRYAANQAAMQRAVAQHLLEVNAMLRPEQRDTFRTLLRTEMFRGIRSSWRTPVPGSRVPH